MPEEALQTIESKKVDLFVGNLSLYTTETKLKEYFEKFGTVLSAKVCIHPENGKSKRFGFITFRTPRTIPVVLSHPHHFLDGKVLETRYASRNTIKADSNGTSDTNSTATIPTASVREEPVSGIRCETPELSKRRSSPDPSVVFVEEKIFVGGVSQLAKVEDLRTYFSNFGIVKSAILLPDHETGRHRGFGFVTFEDAAVAEVVCSSRYHRIKNKQVECKKASPKSDMSLTIKKRGVTMTTASIHASRSNSLAVSETSNVSILGEHPWQALLNADWATSAGLFGRSFGTPIFLNAAPLLASSYLASPSTLKMTQRTSEISDSSLSTTTSQPSSSSSSTSTAAAAAAAVAVAAAAATVRYSPYAFIPRHFSAPEASLSTTVTGQQQHDYATVVPSGDFILAPSVYTPIE